MVHLVVASLPDKFETFKVNYSAQDRKWDLNELIAICVAEETRLKQGKTESANLAVHKNGKKNFKRKGFDKSGNNVQQQDKGVENGSSNVHREFKSNQIQSFKELKPVSVLVKKTMEKSTEINARKLIGTSFCDQINKWLDLPDHILTLITDKLNDNTDFIHFGVVCHTWLSFYTENLPYRKFHRQLPFLLIPTEVNDYYKKLPSQRRLFSLSTKKIISSIELQVPPQMSCIGSTEGWVSVSRARHRLKGILKQINPTTSEHPRPDRVTVPNVAHPWQKTATAAWKEQPSSVLGAVADVISSSSYSYCQVYSALVAAQQIVISQTAVFQVDIYACSRLPYTNLLSSCQAFENLEFKRGRFIYRMHSSMETSTKLGLDHHQETAKEIGPIVWQM
ncbi:hypothetical protein FRX31_003765 [Thalictrum thalictroides]|uniref:F-box protein n=1 Tax=Thalictrum thalictroides TaxID=46969 RepID=A0A7J6XAK1_THATH|nr:hypothetical protein FRX31_003765 [Thalictrum thalictroides]